MVSEPPDKPGVIPDGGRKMDASDDASQTDLSPWESPARSSDESDSTDSGSDERTRPVVNGDVDWTRREIGDHYPVEADYHCNECNAFAVDSISELKQHITSQHDVTWREYLKDSNLHRCAGCGDSLSTLTRLYCEDCTQRSSDRIPCQNCGAVRVNVSDPFCSPECAGEYMTATGGTPPLEPPENASASWLDHPHRLPSGIPAAAPFIANHQLACRECYEYGSDDLHQFAVHVSEKHDFGWSGYIETYELRRCRVCEDPLTSLLPLYCSDVCQRSDPDPVLTCQRDGCGAAVERRQVYCSRDCYLQDAPQKRTESD